MKLLKHVKTPPWSFIRHFTELFADVEARTKLLITLSDGKPEDYDGYRGEYGIEDTRMALMEARREGVHPFCITIDREAPGYLQHMYGAANYVVIDDIDKLPLKWRTSTGTLPVKYEQTF